MSRVLDRLRRGVSGPSLLEGLTPQEVTLAMSIVQGLDFAPMRGQAGGHRTWEDLSRAEREAKLKGYERLAADLDRGGRLFSNDEAYIGHMLRLRELVERENRKR
jgi:hypothetical protein